MNSSRFAIALLTSIAGLVLAGTPTITLANDIAAPLAQAAPAQSAEAGVDLSAQRRMISTGRVGRVGMVTRVGRVGQVGRVGRVGQIGRVGRIGRIEGRIGRIQGRIGRHGRIEGRIGWRIGRVGWRVGRVGWRIGRVGYIPVPVPVGPGIAPVAPAPIAAPPCLVCPVQACLVAVYADPNFTGLSVETAENQPRLDLSGWQNQISSIIVKGGTWEFYPDIEYRGGPPVLRLAPGSYTVLEPLWTKRIGSFMCTR